MKKLQLLTLALFLSLSSLQAQCTFEALFPLKWGTSKYMINEHFMSNKSYTRGKDTVQGSVFLHGLNYLHTVRNMNLSFYTFTNVVSHPCFNAANVALNIIANDSGLVAYAYQVTYPATMHKEYLGVLDSMRTMMTKKFTYFNTVENKTRALDVSGSELTGEGVSYYFNDEPILSQNLTYPQYVIRGGYLAKKPAGENSKVFTNQAEEIQYYTIEILYKMPKYY